LSKLCGYFDPIADILLHSLQGKVEKFFLSNSPYYTVSFCKYKLTVIYNLVISEFRLSFNVTLMTLNYYSIKTFPRLNNLVYNKTIALN